MIAEIREPTEATPSSAVEEARCPMCASRAHFVAIESASGFHVVCCGQCGLHYTSPRPTSEAIGVHYPPEYRPHAGKARRERPLRSWYPLDWLQLPESRRGRPRLLDFGCGAGHFLAAMDRAGWDVVGLDASETAVQAIRETTGLTVYAGSLPHKALKRDTFDCITMWHSLEHVHDPLQTLKKARRLLARDGSLLVAVPNFASWSCARFGANWFGLDLPRHLTHFDPFTLIDMIEMAGLIVQDVRFSRHADWIRESARRSGGWGNKLLRTRWFAGLVARGMREASRDVVMVRTRKSPGRDQVETPMDYFAD